MSDGGGRRAVFAALIGSTLMAVAKFVAWTFTGSSVLLTELVHSMADAGNQALLLVGARQARKVSGDKHHVGSGRERYFWSFVFALVFFVLGSAFATYRGVQQILRPEPIANFVVALLVLAVGIVIEGFTFRTTLVEAIPSKGELSWWNYIRRARELELPVVLLEDFGAQVGLIVAFVSIVMAQTTGSPVWDGIGSLAIGILLGVIAFVLAVEMRCLLIGAGARPQDIKKIKAAILSRPEVMDLVDLHTSHLGPEELLVAARIEFDPSLPSEELALAVDGVERTIRHDVPHARPMYIQPDLRRLGADTQHSENPVVLGADDALDRDDD